MWIAGPLTGLIQPFVGLYNDNMECKYGRRRPVIILCIILTSISLLLLGISSIDKGLFVMKIGYLYMYM
jgi:Na+/melibiose symporter-like transporter